MKLLSQLGRKDITGKVCLLRVDFNVESVKDSLRLEESLPTIKFLLKKKIRILLLSHRGRPNGKDENLSLKFCRQFLEKKLKQKTTFLSDIPSRLPAGNLILLENLRFWPEEEENDLNFAKELAKLGDFYVNDAFAVSHRENSSITQLPKLLPAYVGLLLEKEIKTLSQVMKDPKKPLVLIFGGAKIGDKALVVKNLLPKSAKVLLGSAIINNSDILPRSAKILRPLDWLGEKGNALDIGPLTVKKYAAGIAKAKTIIWNGPLGKFEDKKFAGGSVAIAKAIVKSKAFSVVGGGETTQLILELGLRKKFGFLSTGGGAMLEFLSGKKLPGITALK